MLEEIDTLLGKEKPEKQQQTVNPTPGESQLVNEIREKDRIIAEQRKQIAELTKRRNQSDKQGNESNITVLNSQVTQMEHVPLSQVNAQQTRTKHSRGSPECDGGSAMEAEAPDECLESIETFQTDTDTNDDPTSH